MADPSTNSGKPMADELRTGSQLRAIGCEDLARLGEASLREHLVNTAINAHAKHDPFSESGLSAFLSDTNMVRYPVTIEFAMGTISGHQFAQPEPGPDGAVILYVHPSLQGKNRELAAAVAYFIPVINYGDLIHDDHCILYGATLMGVTINEYYLLLCKIAESVGAIHRDRDENGDRF